MTNHDPLNDLLVTTGERAPGPAARVTLAGVTPGDHQVIRYVHHGHDRAALDIGDVGQLTVHFDSIGDLRAWALAVALDAGDPGDVKHDLAAALMQAHDRAVEAAVVPVAVPA